MLRRRTLRRLSATVLRKATRPAAPHELHRARRDGGAERAGRDAEQEALQPREPDEVAAARATRAQEREVATVPLRRAERSEVREAERDERTRNREHDVQRLRVERVAGGGVEVVGEVVNEDDLSGQRPLDLVA